MATPIPPFRVVEELRAAHWSGDPRQMREAIWNAHAAGVRTWQIAEELGTTLRCVRAAITFPAECRHATGPPKPSRTHRR